MVKHVTDRTCQGNSRDPIEAEHFGSRFVLQKVKCVPAIRQNPSRLERHSSPPLLSLSGFTALALNQAALDFNSSLMMRRSASSNLGDFLSRYSRSAALISV